jgi:putative MATE family efflux protein
VTPKLSRSRTLEGPVAAQVLRFGSPLAVGMGLQVTFNLVDAYLVSRLGAGESGAALGAIGICDQIAAIGSIISFGLSTAAATVTSQRFGAGDINGARKVAWQSTLLVLVLGLAFGLLGLLGADWLMTDLVGARGRVAELGTQYLRVIMGGNVTIFLLLHLTTLQRALGSSKTPVALVLLSNAFNLVFAVLLVYGPGDAPGPFVWGPALAYTLSIPRMGLVGAAWATVLARVIVLFPLVAILVHRFGLFKRETRGPMDRSLWTTLWNLGWPSSTQLVVRIIAMLIVQSLVARTYTTVSDQSATTALGVVFRLETMAIFIGLGWGSAAQTFVGQNLGAKLKSRAISSGWYAAGYNALMMAGLALVYVGFGRSIIAFFDSSPAVVTVAVDYLQTVAFSYVGLGVGIVLGSAIQSAGLTRLTLAIDSVVLFGVLLPSIGIVAYLGLPMLRVWQSVAVSNAAFAVAYALIYRRKGLFDVRIH